jgi:DnaJ-domain-containing protein 1
MGPEARLRPVDSPSQWPEDSQSLAEQLQRRLAISDRDWHALKSQRPRRAAEQLAAALVHLLSNDDPSQAQATEARQRAIALTEHGLQWLKGELRDPGCPSHGR